MVPRLVDSIIIAVCSTVLVLSIATLAAFALSRLRFRAQHHFVYIVLSTRMLPPVAVAIPLFLTYKSIGLYDTHSRGHFSPYHDEYPAGRAAFEKFF